MLQAFIVPKNDPNPDRPRNHGQVWSEFDLRVLAGMATDGVELDMLCAEFGRTRISILAKLQTLGIINEYPHGSGNYHYRKSRAVAGTSIDTITTKDQTIMTIIETKTLIMGEDASKLSDMDIFKKIAAIETTIASLDAIKAKPRKLSELIASMYSDVQKLVDYVDNRS